VLQLADFHIPPCRASPTQTEENAIKAAQDQAKECHKAAASRFKSKSGGTTTTDQQQADVKDLEVTTQGNGAYKRDNEALEKGTSSTRVFHIPRFYLTCFCAPLRTHSWAVEPMLGKVAGEGMRCMHEANSWN
jgi:hypothetical protein